MKVNNHQIRLLITFVAGIASGVLFYPTSSIVEKEKVKIKSEYELKLSELESKRSEDILSLQNKLETQEEVNRQYTDSLIKKMDSLVTENRQLKSSKKVSRFKLVKPDGTVVEKELEESNSEEVTSILVEVKEEFTRRITAIEAKWKKIHEERILDLKKKYDEELQRAREEKNKLNKESDKEIIEDNNKKKLRSEIGLSLDERDYYWYNHMSYTIFGPLFLGGGASGKETQLKDIRMGFGLEL